MISVHVSKHQNEGTPECRCLSSHPAELHPADKKDDEQQTCILVEQEVLVRRFWADLGNRCKIWKGMEFVRQASFILNRSWNRICMVVLLEWYIEIKRQ